MKKMLFSLLSLLLTLGLVMPVSAEGNQIDTPTTKTKIVWQEGMTVEYNGEQFKTLQDALIKVGNSNLSADETAVINCKDGENVGGLFRAVVKNNLVINGNDAYVSDDPVIIPPVTWFPETSDHAIGIELGKDDVRYPLEYDINIEINQLDGIAVWGGRASDKKVNIELNDCQNMHKVMLPHIENAVNGTIDISIDNCSFKHSDDPNDYGLDSVSIRSHYNGTISVTNTTFEGVQIPIDASNRFENGEQEIIVKNSTFTNCGTGKLNNDGEDTTNYAAPIRVTTTGAESSANLVVENCNFLGDNEKINGDILLGNGTSDASDNQGNITFDMSGTKANVMLQQKGYYDENGNVVDKEKAKTIEVLETENISIDESGNVNIEHLNVKHFESKEATCTEDGNIEYWYCDDCGKFFSDKELKNEITKEDTIIKFLGHNYEDGKCTNCGEKDPDYIPEEPTPEVVDKEELESLINELAKLDTKDYTKESYEVLSNALDQASKVLIDKNATKEDVEKAIELLNKANEQLVKVDTTVKPESKPEDSTPEVSEKPTPSKSPDTSDNSLVVNFTVMMILSAMIIMVLKKKES